MIVIYYSKCLASFYLTIQLIKYICLRSISGLAQCAELVWQLRGEAGKRQVEGAKIALQHNYGIGGAAVVTMYGKNRMETAAKL